MTNLATMLRCWVAIFLFACVARAQITYPIVDTNQKRSFDKQNEIVLPKVGKAFYGQDAHYQGNAPKYRKNDNGTVAKNLCALRFQLKPTLV